MRSIEHSRNAKIPNIFFYFFGNVYAMLAKVIIVQALRAVYNNR